MGKIFTLVACSTFFCLLLASCNKEQFAAEKPVYFSIPGFEMAGDVSQTGSNHSLITTTWVMQGRESVGTFEIPSTFPVLLDEGQISITFYPGININGSSSSRMIYDLLEPFDTSLGPQNQDTIFFPMLKTRYSPNATVKVVENFDRAGLDLQPTPISDTSIQKVSDSSKVFYLEGEQNGRAGALYTTNSRRTAEVATSNSFELPQSGANVYLELTYRCNIPFAVGVIASPPSGTIKQPTAVVNARENWNKIYINLVTEVSSITATNRFKIYFAALHQPDVGQGEIYLDNIKLVY